ncbi:MAG: RNA 2',3'-cyclic phosphodiesterase [Streptosporangiales bacterium]|nr:RNA 2',3'-cyclic phosphodiesterase [Streptosporangiales bacterium]
MRLFAALEPPPAALAEVVEALAPVRTELPDLRWAPVERMHLTVAFYGEVPDRSVDDLGARLARAAGRHPALSLAFTGAGAFPGRRRARILWLGVGGDRDPLVRLAASASAAGRRIGLDLDERGYRPHLTVARARRPYDLHACVGRLETYAGTVWPATDLALVRSHQGPEPRYETLETWPLVGTHSLPR